MISPLRALVLRRKTLSLLSRPSASLLGRPYFAKPVNSTICGSRALPFAGQVISGRLCSLATSSVGKMDSEERTASSLPAGIRRVVDDIIVSANDKRKYRGLVLENGLTVLLVHDEKATRAAAALDVHVGE